MTHSTRVFSAVVVLLCFSACAPKTSFYETEVQLIHTQVVVRDSNGRPLAMEVELEYPTCPGDQHETLQGNAEFAQCMAAKYKPGDRVKAVVSFGPAPDDRFDSEVDKIGDCVRPRQGHDERSHEVVAVCNDVLLSGLVAGFRCERKPTKELLAKCPWFRRS
jgi:hypothetical protein